MSIPSARQAQILEKPAIQAFISAARKRSYSTRQSINGASMSQKMIYLVLQGSIAARVDGPDRRELILSYLTPGSFFGELDFGARPEVPSLRLQTRSVALLAEMSLHQFREFNRLQPDLLFEVASQLSARLAETSQRLRELTFLDVAGRVAGTLVNLAGGSEAQVNSEGTLLRMSRRELASIVGCSHEAAGRVLIKMERQGLLISKGREICIPNVSRVGTMRLEHCSQAGLMQ